MLFLDGQQKTAFWKNAGGILDDKPAREGGVDPSLTARTTRASTGSLVLGQVGGWRMEGWGAGAVGIGCRRSGNRVQAQRG